MRSGLAVFLGALLGAALLGSVPARAQLDIDDLVPCAQEGQVCRMPHATNVYFGVTGRTNGRPFPQGGSILCAVSTFGDPAPGLSKMCWYAPLAASGRREEPRGRDLRDDDGRGRRDNRRDERDDDRDDRVRGRGDSERRSDGYDRRGSDAYERPRRDRDLGRY